MQNSTGLDHKLHLKKAQKDTKSECESCFYYEFTASYCRNTEVHQPKFMVSMVHLAPAGKHCNYTI